MAVYDTSTRNRLLDLTNGLAPNTFLNGITVAPNGDAYITDSFNPLLYRLSAVATPVAGAPGAPPAAESTPITSVLSLGNE